MYIYLRSFVVFVLSTFFISAHAETSADLANLLNGVRTMRADFIQTIYDNGDKPIQQGYGRMSLARPGKFRWEVLKPVPQLIIANQSRLWIYDPDLQQVIIRSLHQAGGEAPALLLSYVNPVLDKDFIVEEVQKKNSLRWFKLVPRKKDSNFTVIQIGFLNNQISEMRLQDHLGHITHIQFKRVVQNTDLSPSLFVFKKPANVDVVDETRQRR